MSAMPLSDNDLKICFIDGVLFQDGLLCLLAIQSTRTR